MECIRNIAYCTIVPSRKIYISEYRTKSAGHDRRDGLVVRVSASHAVGRGFTSPPGHTSDHHKKVQTVYLLSTQVLGKEFDIAARPCKNKGRVVCGTLFGGMCFKDPLGSITREGYCIPVPDFYLVLDGIRCRQSNLMD